MKTKILIVAPCLAMGGMERAAVNTAEGINNSESNEVVFLSMFKKEHFFKLNAEIKVIEPDGFNAQKLSILKTIFWIRSVVKNDRPDRILAFNKFYAALCAFALIGIKTPFYISERSSPLYVWKQPMKTIIRLAFWLKSPTGVMAQTSIAANFQKEFYTKAEITVIPNIVRQVKLYPEIERQNVILAVGRLGDYLKGFDQLIEAFALLENKEWELHIAGGDENGQDLKSLADKLGVLSRIQFLGKVKNIDEVYAYAGIYVIPSRSEGFPNALAEAMAANCCCVAFDFTAGPRDIIKDNVTGIIVENGNTSKLAENIDQLIKQPELRMTLAKNAGTILEDLNPEKTSEKLFKFLQLDK